MTDRPMKYQFQRHPDDETFDHIEVTSIERWKESELSGDEYRFTFQAIFYSHGVEMMRRGGRSIEDCMVSASHWFGHSRRENEDDEVKAKWQEARAEVEQRCAQPRCPDAWVVLYHPIKAYTKQGEELVRPPHDDRGRDGGLGWLDVIGFCDRHRHRGDCALDDADHNYELIEERFPAEWAVTDD